jgi:hypothetical protein
MPSFVQHRNFATSRGAITSLTLGLVLALVAVQSAHATISPIGFVQGEAGRTFYRAAVDGETAIVSGFVKEWFVEDGDPSYLGWWLPERPAAWIYVRNANGWLELTELGQLSGTVALNGNTAVVADAGDDLAAPNGGALHVYVRDDNGTVGNLLDDSWNAQATLRAGDADANDFLGLSPVALQADVLVAGVEQDDDRGLNTGAVYVFVRHNGVWSQQAKLQASDINPAPNANFGVDVDLEGDTIVVGARYGGPYVAALDTLAGQAIGAPARAGQAYVFTRDDNGTAGDMSDDVWSETTALVASDTAAGTVSEFGANVDISGDTIAVGATSGGMSTPGAFDGQGRYYVFERSGGGWPQQALLAPPLVDNSGANGLLVGGPDRMVLTGDALLVGLPWDDDGCGLAQPDCNRGRLIVFERSGGTWSQTQALSSGYVPSGAPGRFGFSIASDGSRTWALADGDFISWGPNDEPYQTGTWRWYVLEPDVDADGMADGFESGFGGPAAEDSLAITNPETGDNATATGSAESGATITSGSFEIDLPPNTSVDSGSSQIEITFVPGNVARVEVSGADLDGGTKSITLPYNVLANEPAVCINDSPTASIDNIFVDGSCNGTLIAIPDDVGDATNQGGFTVTYLSLSPPRIRVDGLHHTALATLDMGISAPPVIADVTADATPVQVGSPVTASATFTDADDANAHTAAWHWGDGATSSGVVDQADNTVAGSHVYDEPGVYTVSIDVTDPDADSSESTASGEYQYVVVYDPTGGFVTGGGWIHSPAGAYLADPGLSGKANFGFEAKYKQGKTVPDGNTEFQFKAGNLNFRSTGDYMWLVVSGSGHKATYKGTGKINGSGDYGVMVTAIDAANMSSTDVDLLRIKIWDKASGGGVVYDNQQGAGCGNGNGDDADPCTAIGGGNIKIHKD